VPARMRTTSGFLSVLLKIGEPQRLQNTRFFPGEDSNALSRSEPAVMWKAAAGTGMFVTSAAPCAFLHCWQ
jgi:hypothetical protein